MAVFVTGGSGFVGGRVISRLVDEGRDVRALVRSPRAAEIVTALGARAVTGSLTDGGALVAAMGGSDSVVHAAARLTAGPREHADMYETNVVGTQTVLAAAQRAGVATFVHISTEQVIMGTGPLDMADETWPYPRRHRSFYGATKAAAEALVLATPPDRMRAIAVRPRFVWGAGDRTLLPSLVQAVRSGTFRWVGGGNHLTSTCHVDNVVDGVLCALQRGDAGEAYFITDGPPQHFRPFVSALLSTQDVRPPVGSSPRWSAFAAASVVEFGWKLTRRPGPAPLDRSAVAIVGQQCTVDDSKARTAIGYRPRTTIDHGLAQLRET